MSELKPTRDRANVDFIIEQARRRNILTFTDKCTTKFICFSSGSAGDNWSAYTGWSPSRRTSWMDLWWEGGTDE